MAETIEFTAPEQPSRGSVVLDAQGRAWQRTTIGDDLWHRAGSLLGNGVNWAFLVIQQSPLKVIYRPEGDSRAAA